MFQCSASPAIQHFQALEAAGASDISGTTADRTNYFKAPRQPARGLALWLEPDRMGYCSIGRSGPFQPAGRGSKSGVGSRTSLSLAEETLVQSLVPPGHPYYGNVIGTHEDIQAVKLEDVQRFFRQYYAPNNASIAIVGDIDVAQTKALVQKYFGTLKRGTPVPPIKAQTPKITSERRKIVPSRVNYRRSTWPGSPRRFTSRATPCGHCRDDARRQPFRPVMQTSSAADRRTSQRGSTPGPRSFFQIE